MSVVGAQTANINLNAGMPPKRIARMRRATFFSFVGLGTIVGTWLMYTYLAEQGMRKAEWLLLATFLPLYYQLNVGFWTAMFGMWLMNRPKPDPLNLWRTLKPEDHESEITASTAIIMPVFNEDVTRVFEGLRAIYLSLEQTGHSKNFDIFILSDSNQTSQWIEEETAWLELCRQLNAFGRIFYRKRRKPINRKSGNVSDFCRRWGKRYRYMIVLDADSLMSGSLLTSMTRIMEKNPGIGILQTFPKQIGAETLLGRVMQFAQSLYGLPFMDGLDYWQCGEANFWGHNAIIRLEPFIKYCALPALPGKEPFGGHILSHDFVEAALMRKAGYAVRLLPTNRGSYEEGPPTLVDMLKRDRRWCQGNMQHFWLLFAKGWHFMSRINFAHGILSYASSLLWLLFLVFSTFLAATPVAHIDPQAVLAMQILLGVTVMLIFLPKFAILLDEMITGRMHKTLKGRMLTYMSSMADTVVFTLMAPVLMIFHSQFVVYTVLGKGVRWVTQRRKVDGGVDWAEVFFNLWPITAIGVVWGVIAWMVSHGFLLWISPIVGALLISIPVGILVSGRSSGLRFGLFLTPEETDPPTVLSTMNSNLTEIKGRIHLPPELEKFHGLLQVCLDPYVNGLHVSLLRRRKSIDVSRAYLDQIADRLIKQGPSSLSPQEMKAMIHDTETMTDVHYRIWSARDSDLAPFWATAIRQYNLAASSPFTHTLAQQTEPVLA
ncbi:glucans biosynthesis glucosyltransferase MdoH [Brevifollis gellanilyticus]|uniref:Glucans biosynthesis glucosyltransferase H n=1 Tax=Brevifollis gellanilyticus TaxID=748831 RepID=A0A512MCA7_9BACT|nr:glucans biosynthesis glucosyltransferase MdoH [Brevifollis gellanilyticus]GEP44368.1 glucans biosynthesis glucosyltransferase H [Brevifollis gellanilyticus]